jgi:integrase
MKGKVMTNKIAILPQLYTAGDNLKKDWFVFYSYFNSKTGKLKRFRIYKGLSKSFSKEERLQNAQSIINEYTCKLKSGWNPFLDEKTIYRQSYEKIDRKIEELRKTNKCFSYFSERFLKENNNVLEPSSIWSYKSQFNTFLKFLREKGFEQVDINYYPNNIAEEFIIEYLKNRLNRSNTTANNYIIAMSRIYQYFMQKENSYIEFNPFKKMKKLKQYSKPARYFKTATIEKLKTIIINHDPQLWLAILFQYYTFIRPKEIRLLQIRHINIEDAIIHLDSNVSKNKKNQTVVIPKPFLDFLKQIKVDQWPDDYYIISLKGHPHIKGVSKNYLGDHFRKIRDGLGLSKDFKFYSWKHTGAISLTRTGVSVREIQDHLRHHSLEVVQVYLQQLRSSDSIEIREKFPEI